MTLATVSPEWNLLRAAIRADATLPGPVDLAEDWAQVNWDRLLWLGYQQHALSCLHEAIRAQARVEQCPPGVWPQLAAFREVNQLCSLSRARELCQLQDIFQREAIPALCADIWLISRQTFRSVGWGPLSSRLEFLVPAQERERAATAVAATGRTVKGGAGKLHRADRSPVKLASLRGSAAADRRWAEAPTCVIGGRTLRHLAPVDWMLWEADTEPEEITLPLAAFLIRLAAQLTSADWAQVVAEARHLDVAAAIATSLSIAHAAFGLPLPGESARLMEALPPALPASGPLPIIDPPFLPTPEVVMRRMLTLAGVSPSDVVYDLGCGDGRMIVMAAKEFGARGVGIDFDPALIAKARALAAERGVTDRVEFRQGNILEADFCEASVVSVYLMPGIFQHLERTFREHCRAGLRIVSHDYDLGPWAPERTEIIRTGPVTVAMVYLWRVPTPVSLHRAFGLNIRSCLPLPEALPLQAGDAAIEVEISYGEIPAELPGVLTRDEHLQAAPNALRLEIEDVATFWIRDGRSIVIARHPAAQDDEVRAFLLGSAFGALLHQRRDLVLHGSAVEWEGGCLVFIGESGIGKSTLASAFRKKGHAILTDDLCVIRPGADGRMLAHPSFPQTKLWLDSLQQLEVSPEGLRRIHYKEDKRAVPLGEDFATTPLPVRKIFLLSAHARADLTVTPAQGPAKFSILTAHTYRFSYLAGMERATGHFQQAMALAQQVPVAVIARPEGEFRLDELVALIERDVAASFR